MILLAGRQPDQSARVTLLHHWTGRDPACSRFVPGANEISSGHSGHIILDVVHQA